jgi:hypothetical protein
MVTLPSSGLGDRETIPASGRVRSILSFTDGTLAWRRNHIQEGTRGGILIQAEWDVHEESKDDACVVFKYGSLCQRA